MRQDHCLESSNPKSTCRKSTVASPTPKLTPPLEAEAQTTISKWFTNLQISIIVVHCHHRQIIMKRRAATKTIQSKRKAQIWKRKRISIILSNSSANPPTKVFEQPLVKIFGSRIKWTRGRKKRISIYLVKIMDLEENRLTWYILSARIHHLPLARTTSYYPMIHRRLQIERWKVRVLDGFGPK